MFVRHCIISEFFCVNLQRGNVYCCRHYSVRFKFLDVLYFYFVISLFEFALK